jgi:hypothetical protein
MLSLETDVFFLYNNCVLHFCMLRFKNPTSFPSFVAGDTEPQSLIKLFVVYYRVLATCFIFNVVNIIYTVYYQTLNHCMLV